MGGKPFDSGTGRSFSIAMTGLLRRGPAGVVQSRDGGPPDDAIEDPPPSERTHVPGHVVARDEQGLPRADPKGSRLGGGVLRKSHARATGPRSSVTGAGARRAR